MLELSERERVLKEKTEREKWERAKWKALEEWRERQRLEEVMRQRNREPLPNYNLNHDADQHLFRESTGFLTADTPADLAIFRRTQSYPERASSSGSWPSHPESALQHLQDFRNLPPLAHGTISKGGVIIKEKQATQPSSTKDRNPFSNFRAPALEPFVHERFESLTKAPPSREALLAIPRASSRLTTSSENTGARGALDESDSIVVPAPAPQKHHDSLSRMSLMCNATDATAARIPSSSCMYNAPVSMSLPEYVFRRTRSTSPRVDASDAFSSRGLRTADGAGKGRPVTVTENLRLVRTRRSYGERLLLNSLRNEVQEQSHKQGLNPKTARLPKLHLEAKACSKL